MSSTNGDPSIPEWLHQLLRDMGCCMLAAPADAVWERPTRIRWRAWGGGGYWEAELFPAPGGEIVVDGTKISRFPLEVKVSGVLSLFDKDAEAIASPSGVSFEGTVSGNTVGVSVSYEEENPDIEEMIQELDDEKEAEGEFEFEANVLPSDAMFYPAKY